MLSAKGGLSKEFESADFALIAQRVIDKTGQVNVPQPIRHTGNPVEKELWR